MICQNWSGYWFGAIRWRLGTLMQKLIPGTDVTQCLWCQIPSLNHNEMNYIFKIKLPVIQNYCVSSVDDISCHNYEPLSSEVIVYIALILPYQKLFLFKPLCFSFNFYPQIRSVLNEKFHNVMIWRNNINSSLSASHTAESLFANMYNVTLSSISSLWPGDTIYKYTHTHTHTHTYIYTYIYSVTRPQWVNSGQCYNWTLYIVYVVFFSKQNGDWKQPVTYVTRRIFITDLWWKFMNDDKKWTFTSVTYTGLKI